MEFNKDDYDPALIEALDAIHGDAENELECMEMEPDDSPTNIVRDYQVSKCLVNGKIATRHRLGTAEDFAFGEYPGGSLFFTGIVNNVHYEDANEISSRLQWLESFCVGPYFVEWHRRDTGDGILLPDYDVTVAFANADDEQRYLKHGVAA